MEAPIRSSTPRPDAGAQKPRSPFSKRIGSLAGIDIYVHGTFLLLLAWIAGTQLLHGGGIAGALGSLTLVLAVFGIVVLHELGHALMARRFGIGTRDITLLPIGGVASLERMPEDPKQELLVAFAGPAVNFVLAGVCFAVLTVLGQTVSAGSVWHLGGPFVSKLMWINLSLGIFNLLPAFPMDGGRVLRAALALKMNHMRATDVAARVGQGLAVLLGIAGFFTNPMLVFIAIFVWMGARSEASMEHVRTSIEGVKVGDIMQGGQSLMADETVGGAAHVLSVPQETFPVIDGDTIVGVVAREDLLRALGQGASLRIQNLMTRDIAVTEPLVPLTQALQAMGQSSSNVLFVVDRGKLVGMVTPRMVRELIVMREARRTPMRGSVPQS